MDDAGTGVKLALFFFRSLLSVTDLPAFSILLQEAVGQWQQMKVALAVSRTED